MPPSTSFPIPIPFLPTTNIPGNPRVPGNYRWELRPSPPPFASLQGTGKSHMACLGPCKPLWGFGLNPSRGPQPRSPALLSALHQTRAPLLILALPAAACAKRCNLPPARRSPRRRPAARWRFYVAIKNHLKGHFVSLSAACSTGGGRQRDLGSIPPPGCLSSARIRFQTPETCFLSR